MNDPPPLKQVTSHAFVRQLLQSVEADQSAVGARDRALSVLGLGALSATGVAVGVSQAATTTAHAGVTSLASTSVALVSLKWTFVGLLGGLITVAGAASVLRQTSPSGITQPIGSVRSPQPRVERQVALAQPPLPMKREAEAQTPELNELRAAPTAQAPPPASPDTRGSARLSSPHLAAPLARAVRPPTGGSDAGSMAQLEALRVIRAELSARRPERALALIDGFDRRFGATRLAEEAIVLRIETLADLGRTRDARALGATFVAQHPNSAYARRVQATVGEP